jgi:transcriptional regulator with XRE-family HTH domain
LKIRIRLLVAVLRVPTLPSIHSGFYSQWSLIAADGCLMAVFKPTKYNRCCYNREETKDSVTGDALRTGREEANLTQLEAASKLGLTQAYLSMLERGRRPVTAELAAQAMKVFNLPPTALPLESDRPSTLDESAFKAELGALGYPGFSYLRGKSHYNPARLLFLVLDQDDLDRRVVEALPWLVYTYPEMDWEWLTRNAKLNDRQNRLGFVVALAVELATKTGDDQRARKLAGYKSVLERSRLMREDTLCHDSMTRTEHRWLRHNRPPEARHWNLLTDLKAEHL